MFKTVLKPFIDFTDAVGILQNKFVLAIDGQAQEMSYSMMPSELQKKDVIAGLNQNKAMIVTVLSALIFNKQKASRADDRINVFSANS